MTSVRRWFVRLLALAASAAAVQVTPMAHAQGTLFLRVDKVTGTSLDPDHLDWLDARSMGFGVSRSVSMSPGGSRAVSQAALSELQVTRTSDASTPRLFALAAAGEPGNVELDFTSGSPARRYYHIRLAEALVSSYSQSSGGDTPVESVTFNCTRIETTYTDLSRSPAEAVTALYDVVLDRTDLVTNTLPLNSPPVISPIGDTNMTGGTLTFTFSAFDPDGLGVTLSASSSNPGLLAASGIVFGMLGNNQTISLTPAPNQTGITTVTVLAGDGTYTTSRSFHLTVTAPPASNMPPVLLVTDASVIPAIASRPLAIRRVQVQDPDAGASPLSLLVTAQGALTVGNAAGVTVSNNGGSMVLITGSAAALNAMLFATNGLTYTPLHISGTDIISLTLNDNGATGVGGPMSVQMSLGVRVFLSQFEQWQHEHFTDAELADASREGTLWGPNADPDADGLQNLAEYALGTDPRSTQHSRPVATWVTNAAGASLVLNFLKRVDPDLHLTVAVGSDVASQSFTSDPASVQASPPQDLGNGFERVVFTDLTPVQQANKRFMRLTWNLAFPP